MKRIQASVLSLLLVLVVVLSALSPVHASAAVLDYSKDSNSGERDVVCTTLDGTSAADYYTGSYTYDNLSTLSSSALFTSLQTLMRDTHSYTSSYDDCHYMANQTDCENNNTDYLSLIYTSYDATQAQWNGWNREHVWPKSLGGDSTTGGGADLHHIRPSDAGVNSSRGNKPYGESGSGATEKYGSNPATGVLGGTYNSTYFEPLDNVKGDVARICLYVYVRWNSSWGATDVTKVFESVDILLEWCELDPVDTWEMGRNEVVQEIQGNRNVFIDYPEYAWLLFDREVPDDMVTPSGEAMGTSGGSMSGGSSSCEHTNTTTTVTKAATCTATGLSTETCNDCGGTSTTVIPATGHTPDSGVVTPPTCTEAGYTTFTCTVCAVSYTGNIKAATGHSYADGVCTVCGTEEPDGFVLVTDVSQLNVGDQIIIVAKDSNYALSTTQNNNNRDQITIIKNGTTIAPTDGMQIITLEAGTLANTFAFNVGDGYLYAASSSNNYLRTETTLSDNSSWAITITDDGTATILAQGSYTRNLLQYNSGNTLFSCYDPDTSTQEAVSIYKLGSDNSCAHTNTTTTTIDATCTVEGSITVTCDDCGATVSSESIPTIDHNYVDGTCTECGEADGTGDAVTETETLTYVFSDYTAGTQYAENEEHILDENTTVTTTQAHFTSELRLYSSSTYNGYAIIQSVNPITAIVVNAGNKVDTLNVYACNDGNTWVLVGTISVTSTSYNNYTLDLGGAYNYVKLDVAGSNQVRIKSMSLTVEKAVDDDCSHTNTTTTTIDATCTVAGSITVTCDDCSIVISTTPISATGHQNTTTTTIDATCTVEGSITVTCNDCGATVSSESIPTIDHNYVDGTCSECGEEQTATPSETTVGITIADYADSNNWVNGQKYNSIEFDSNITVTASGTSNTGSYYTSGENWRIYQSDSGTITFNASNGCKISSITITYTSSNTGTLVFNGANVSSGTEITVNSETATFSMGNTGSASNGQARITAIDVVYTQPDACEHTNTTTTTIDATCTVAGSITVTCDDCSEVVSESEIPALGHNYVSGVCTRCDSVLPVATFNVPLGASSVTSILGPSVTLPAAPTLPGVPLDYAYEFVGWALEAQNGATVAPTLYAPNSVIEIDENTVFYAVYSYTDTVTTQINGYIEKDINEIQSTDVVVITVTTESGTVYAMSNDKGTSAAPTAVTITVNGNAIVGDVAANLLWNISNSGGNLTIYPDGTTATWLYCTSTNNGVRVGTNANKVFTIDSSTGYLKNTATSRYIGVYTTNPDWRCYTNTTGNTANQTLRFFVKTNSSVTTETVCYTTTLEFSSGFTGASLNVGEDLSVRYHALIDENPEAYTVRFTMNGEEIIVSGVEENGKYVFSFCGIAPQCMGDVIKAELLLGGEVIDTIEEYSVKQYVLDAIEYYPTDTHLHQLLHDMLVYGAMAQKYRGYKKDTLVTDGVAGLTPSALTPSQSDNAFAGNNAPDADTTLVKFISAGVRFDYDNKIFVKITTTESISNITIRVGGEALEIIDLGDDKYVAYSDRISALDFDESVLFELLYDGQLVQTLTYSVNTYAYNKQADAEIGDLVLALYRYGKSAEAYSLSKE